VLIDRSAGILLTLTDRTYKLSAAGKNGEQFTFERPIQSTGNQLGLSNNSPSASLWLGRTHGHNYFTFPKTSRVPSDGTYGRKWFTNVYDAAVYGAPPIECIHQT
jgi:hypothetical protein